MAALGTHQPMTEKAICDRLGISLAQRRGRYRAVQLINHDWQNPDALISLGIIPAKEISELSGALFAMDGSLKLRPLCARFQTKKDFDMTLARDNPFVTRRWGSRGTQMIFGTGAKGLQLKAGPAFKMCVSSIG
jgi:hypothetical protein